MRIIPPGIGPALILAALASARADDPAPRVRVHVDRIVIDDHFPDAYQVEVADLNGDGKPDIVALGGNTIAWYENPAWTKHVIATGGDPLKGDIISSATADMDGDGKPEIAIACDFAMNTPTRGQLWLASQGATAADPWPLLKLAEIPSIHRVRWADLEGDGRPELIVAPLFGPKAAPPTYDQDPAQVVGIGFDRELPKIKKWTGFQIMQRPVVHAVGVIPATGDRKTGIEPGSIITADNTGLSLASAGLDDSGHLARGEVFPGVLVPGASGSAPKRGCSDFRRLATRDGQAVFATIEPWHGSELVVWAPPPRPANPEATAKTIVATAGNLLRGQMLANATRTVIDATLDDGHALWAADVDGDGTDEIFAGHRGKDHRVAMYRLEGTEWARTIIDRQIAAQDLRGGDLDNDGVPDIVAVGGSTHNVVWYRPTRLKLKGEPAAAGR